jgi:hypothetical protein
MHRLLALVILLVLTLSGCGDGDEDTATDPGSPNHRAGWNTAIEPPLTVDGLAVPVAAELAVVPEPGPVTGDGIIGVSVSAIAVDDDHLYLELGRTAGCPTFDVTALVPTDEIGVYELFHDTDNLCEAFMISGFRTALTDLVPGADDTITIVESSGAATSTALN